ncbi:HXXEE domain-containing protein [Paracoccus sp. AK26]|uniref:HXXEE domain-containing protein n=1 Tax=Paracoccus sp. AK26 TaxID=2589076 RepID=UPI001428010E|nr:HXXEE domain-containing protein [Paracoccus sp. AK26]QIR86982.1 HXXEE domain-containing protein [Paracoccus sp. AK26]
MSLSVLAWLCLAAYALHALEEFQMNWRDWAQDILKLPVGWPDFYVTNAAVLVLGAVQAQVALALPAVPLVFASLMLINAVFFHVLPTIVTRVYSPGTATAVLLFLPLGVQVFRNATATGSAGLRTCLAALAGGALLMAFPVVMLKIRHRHHTAAANA